VANLQEERAGIVIREVKGRIGEAVAMLRSLGTDYQRIAWLLEDTVTYLDEAVYELQQEDADLELPPSEEKEVNGK